MLLFFKDGYKSIRATLSQIYSIIYSFGINDYGGTLRMIVWLVTQ